MPEYWTHSQDARQFSYTVWLPLQKKGKVVKGKLLKEASYSPHTKLTNLPRRFNGREYHEDEEKKYIVRLTLHVRCCFDFIPTT